MTNVNLYCDINYNNNLREYLYSLSEPTYLHLMNYTFSNCGMRYAIELAGFGDRLKSSLGWDILNSTPEISREEAVLLLEMSIFYKDFRRVLEERALNGLIQYKRNHVSILEELHDGDSIYYTVATPSLDTAYISHHEFTKYVEKLLRTENMSYKTDTYDALRRYEHTGNVEITLKNVNKYPINSSNIPNELLLSAEDLFIYYTSIEDCSYDTRMSNNA